MKRWKRPLIVATSVVLSLGAAATVAAAPESLDDRDIALAVETELILDDAVPAHRIDVSADDGIVTLSGSVDTYAAKLDAKDAAESVKGVLAVVNNIDVEPVVRLDTQIRGDVVTALAVDPATDALQIDVTVDHGVVALSGEVDSYSEKILAEDVAEQVKGVIDVKNLLTYDFATDQTDAEIKADVQSRLRSDASIDAALIDVAVDDGKVTLSGSVGSATEKNEAETEAWWVAGVKSVTNSLDVKWWLDADTSEWDGWTDADMRQAVESALLTSPRVKSFNVTTTVEDGVATLTGTVDNLAAKRAAEEEADDVLGVWRVKNYLRVRPPVTRSDAEIASNVRDALRRNPYVDRYDIKVSVYNGKAHLNGEVDSWYMKDEAGEVASKVPGVIDVQSNLDVDYEFAGKSDQEIKEDIESQLWWSPFVDSDHVTVEVHSGVATLMGTVEDWDELQSAKENAREGGATEVISKLEISNGIGAG